MNLTDWLAATFFVSEEDAQMHKDVAAAQQAIVDRQYAEGKRGVFDYLGLSSDIKKAGDYTADFKEKNSGLGALLLTVPWWIWAALLALAFWWVGGFYWIRNILKR